MHSDQDSITHPPYPHSLPLPHHPQTPIHPHHLTPLPTRCIVNLYPQELEESEERYKEAHSDQDSIRRKYQKEIDELKRRLEEAAAELDAAKVSRHLRPAAKGENTEIAVSFCTNLNCS